MASELMASGLSLQAHLPPDLLSYKLDSVLQVSPTVLRRGDFKRLRDSSVLATQNDVCFLTHNSQQCTYVFLQYSHLLSGSQMF